MHKDEAIMREREALIAFHREMNEINADYWGQIKQTDPDILTKIEALLEVKYEWRIKKNAS